MNDAQRQGSTDHSEPLDVLLLEDDPGDARLVEEYLQKSDLETSLEWEETLSAGFAAARSTGLDVMVVDLEPLDSKNADPVRRRTEASPVPVVILTDAQNLDAALNALDAKATEHLRKEKLTPALLARTLQWAVERSRIETTRRKSQKRLRRAQRIANLGYWERDLRDDTLVWSKGLRRIFGWDEERDVTYGTFMEAVHPEDRERLRAAQDAVLAGEAEEIDIEYRIRRPTGEERAVHEQAEPERNEKGRPILVTGAVLDVTEREKRQRELRRQKDALQRERSLLQQTQRLAGAWEVDPRSGEGSRSEEVSRILEVEDKAGLTAEESFQFFTSEARPKLREAFEECVEEGTPYDLELPLITAKGNRRWVRTVAGQAETEGGEVTKVAGALQDITDRKEAEQALKESEELHRATLSNITDTVLLTREDGTFSYVCPNVGYIFGYTEEEVEELGSITALLGTDPAEEHDFEGAQEISNVEQSVVDASGDRHDLLINVRRVSIQDGRRMYTCRDITERKKAEQALREERDRFATLFESLPSPVARCEIKNGTPLIADVNGAFENVFGVEASAAEGKDIGELVLPQSGREEVPEIVHRALEEEILRQEVRRPAADGLRDFQLQAAGRTRTDGAPEVYVIYTDITERNEQERRLRRTNRRLQAVLDTVEAAVFIKDTEGRYQLMNQQCRKLLGIGPEEEIAGRTDRDLFTSDTADRYRADDRRVMEEGETLRIEEEVPVPEGTQINLTHKSPLRDEGGEIVGVCAVSTDITDQKQRQRQLQRTRERIEIALEATGAVVWDLDVESGEVSLYPSSQVLYETDIETREDFLAQIHSEDRKRVEENLEKGYGTGAYEAEFRVAGKEGTRWIATQGRFKSDTETGHLRGTGVARDITERKRSHHKLERYRDYTDRLLNATEDLFFVFDTEGTLHRWNEQVASVTGYSDEELSEMSALELVPESDREKTQAAIAEVFEKGRSQLETRLLTKDGSTIPYDLTGNRVEHPDGDPRLVSIGRDVTDRKRRENELVQAKEEAEEASRVKSAVMANMSHEIRTPLTSIIGFAEVLKVQGEGEAAQFAERIRRGGERLMKTLDSVLQLSRLEAGGSELEREEVNLNEVARETIETLRPAAEEKSIALETELLEGPAEGQWNEGALDRILENLLENAIKFTPEGGRVEIRARMESGEAILEVEDSGIGVSGEVQSKIFEAFKQESEGLDREYEGTGLGLSIARRLAEGLGGTVEVESEKGEGACFTVRLPRTASEAGPAG